MSLLKLSRVGLLCRTHESTLHSTMSLLKLIPCVCYSDRCFRSLHSTMSLLKLPLSAGRPQMLTALHSTMSLLKLHRYPA